ncbi:G/T mismatch-specific thymine DNA glycosylase [Orchesella cincta]|uniref:G/T mismatch-specific thymine DNA glycosylase n=1 Tax=Orchesella cincta TaxID=48709 RepID=A0A1D2M5G4_ORCCI|nr:G/T mismatch-specific thymine DNA glycosylase [Orchesella cincta]
MKPETQVDDGYENSIDSMFGNIDRMIDNTGAHINSGMRHHLNHVMDDHIQHNGRSPVVNPSLKMDHYGDPYNFVDEMTSGNYTPVAINPPSIPSQVKKRGRRKKSEINRDAEFPENKSCKESNVMDAKERKRHDRFNGLSEEEVSRKTLPDHITPNLDILMVGINPGMFAAFKGHHYAGPGNHFWKCLYLSGLVPEPMTADDDFNLMRYGIGFTNIVARPTKGSADLTRREIKQGCQLLLEKIKKFRPKVAVFNGKLIYEVFSGKKDFPFGRQSEFVEGTNTYIWVMPSSSARCAQLPRAADKVPFYSALKKFRDYLNGLILELDDSEVVFPETSKPSAAKLAAGTVAKKPRETGALLHSAVENTNGDGPTPAKKKRGRPRKGMEKANSVAAVSEDSSKHTSIQPDGSQKKRRGRPKKQRPDEGGCSSVTPVGNHTPDMTMENVLSGAIGTCKPSTASSVSSGYSSGTASSNDDRRRDENGSLSNTGSSGPSPSHHSFTTQSDLSSEISAAISCGSAPPSPLNNQTESLFDGISGSNNHYREEAQAANKHHSVTSIHNSNPNPPSIFPNTTICHNTSNVRNPSESHESSYPSNYHQPYENRLPPQQSNSRSQQGYQPPNIRAPSENTHPSSSSSSYPNFETSKPSVDVTSRSLSGLESLVDQIPSIGDADVVGSSGLAGVAPVNCQDSVTHAPSVSLPSVTSAVSHAGHYGDAPSGFLPYSHGSAYGATHPYVSAPYYASELSSNFHVNSLSSPYCPPTPTSSLMFGYPGYHSQYSSASAPPGYGGTGGAASFHLPTNPYGNHSGFTSPYSGPNPYAAHGTHPMSGANQTTTQRLNQRFHNLRQEGMDLGHLGFGGF